MDSEQPLYDEPLFEQVLFLRRSTRNLLKLNRQKQKDEESDARRAVESKSLSREDISDISNRLKNKSGVSTQELHWLKNALLDDKFYWTSVLVIPGALRGLVRELSGTDIERQCAAAGCCCNLALGNAGSSVVIAKGAGSYLVTTLDSLVIELAGTCAWAIGNIAGAGPHTCEILIAQGALTKLLDLLSVHEDLRDAALYALVHLAYSLKDGLKLEHLEKILQALINVEVSKASSQLLFILSCHEHFDTTEFPERLLQKVLEDTAVSTGKHVSNCQEDRCCELLYLFRTLANVSEKWSSVILNCLRRDGIYKFCFPAILLSEDTTVVQALLWLLGNLYKYCDDKEFFTQLMSGY